MNIGDIAEFITSKLGKTDTDSVDVCKKFIRQRHQMIYDSDLWKDSIAILQFDLPEYFNANAYDQEMALPYEIDRPMAVALDDQTLNYAELQYLIVNQPSDLFQTGTPLAFTEVEPRVFDRTLNIGDAGAFRITASAVNDPGDDGVVIHCKGSIDGRPLTEDITLTTATVLGSKFFDKLVYVSKPITKGAVNIDNSTGNIEAIPWECTKYQRAVIRFNNKPKYVSGETIKINVLGKRRIRPLMSDLDELQIRGIENAVLAYVEGDMLERMKQYGKAQVKFSEGQTMLAVARDTERAQSAHVQRLTPTTGFGSERIDLGW